MMKFLFGKLAFPAAVSGNSYRYIRGMDGKKSFSPQIVLIVTEVTHFSHLRRKAHDLKLRY
jgi:hypothetical protein